MTYEQLWSIRKDNAESLQKDNAFSFIGPKNPSEFQFFLNKIENTPILIPYEQILQNETLIYDLIHEKFSHSELEIYIYVGTGIIGTLTEFLQIKKQK